MSNSAVNFEKSLLTTLKADSGVSAIVGSRVYAMIMPQNSTLPAVTFQRINGRPANTLSGRSGLEEIDLQIDCWASSFAQAKTLAVAVRDAMPDVGAVWSSRLQSDQDLYDEDNEYFRVLMEYKVWFLEN